MKGFLEGAVSRRWGYDGWALKFKGAEQPIWSTTCTTRREARELLRELRERDLVWRETERKMEIVKVRIKVQAVE